VYLKRSHELRSKGHTWRSIDAQSLDYCNMWHANRTHQENSSLLWPASVPTGESPHATSVYSAGGSHFTSEEQRAFDNNPAQSSLRRPTVPSQQTRYGAPSEPPTTRSSIPPGLMHTLATYPGMAYQATPQTESLTREPMIGPSPSPESFGTANHHVGGRQANIIWGHQAGWPPASPMPGPVSAARGIGHRGAPRTRTPPLNSS
jgi:hypothetical protein